MNMNVVTKVDPGPYQNFLILLFFLIVILILIVVVVWLWQVFLIIQLCKQRVGPTTVQEICGKSEEKPIRPFIFKQFRTTGN